MDIKTKKKDLWVILFTSFLNMLTISTLIPVLPLLLTDTSSPYYILNNSYFEGHGFILLGALTAIFPLAVFFFGPILGELSDSYGRKKVLLISVLGSFISNGFFAYGVYSSSLLILFISRFIDGVTGANIATLQASIGDISTKENRAKNFGLMGATFGVGFIIGPALGGVLSNPSLSPLFSPAFPFVIATILSLLNVLFIVFFFRETHTFQTGHTVKLHPGRSLIHIREAFKNKKMEHIFQITFLQTTGFTFFTTIIGAYLIYRFSFSQTSIGYFFAFVGVCNVLNQVFVIPRIAKKYSEIKILSVSLAAFSVLIAGHAFAPTEKILYFIIPFFSLSASITINSLSSYTSSLSDEKNRGKILGVKSSVESLAQAIAPLLAGLLANYLSPQTPLLAASLIIILSWAQFVMHKKRHS